MAKKIGYKTSSIIALTLAGAGITAHNADAAEQNSTSQATPQNVLDDQTSLDQAEQTKSDVTSSQQGVVSTQQYKDPTQVQTLDQDSPSGQSTPDEIILFDTEDSSVNDNTSQEQTNSIDTHSEAEVPEAEYNSLQENQATDNTKANTTPVTNQNTDSQSEDNTQSDATQAVNQNADTQSKDNTQTDAAQVVNQNADTQSKDNTQTDAAQVVNQNADTQSKDNTQTDAAQAVNQNTDAQLKDSAQAVEQSKATQPTSTKQVQSTQQPVAKSVQQPKNISSNQAKTTETAAEKRIPTSGTAFRSATTSKPVAYAMNSNRPAAYQPKVKSKINDYIRKQKFSVPRYEEDYSSYFPKYGYRNGVGKPEGIIIHDTANDRSTINDEISYMKRNYQSAFVHGFIDGQRIVETQPTDYLAWGAGPIANERYIHIELVHVHDSNSFARQMNYMADYAATNLQYYGLKPDSAENDGRGTVWTHNAVSQWLGGTDHVDPHGYLRAHGYSYDELYDLINEKYQVKMGLASPAYSTGSTTPSTPSTGSSQSKLSVSANTGYLRINTKNSGLYTTVYDQAGKSTRATNQTLKVTKKASLNGQNFYLASDAKTNALLGWVKTGETTYQAAQGMKNINHSYQVKPKTVVYSVPWGTKSQVLGTTHATSNQTLKASKSQVVGGTQWLYGTVGKLTGWINSSNTVQKATPQPSTLKVTTDTGVGRIKSTNDGLYVSVYDQAGKTTRSTNLTLNVSKRAKLGDKAFYLVSDYATGTNIGWVKQSDVDYRTTKPATAHNKVYTIPSGTKLYQVPWGTSRQVAGTVSGQGSQIFTASQQRQIGNATYVFGKVKNISGWVNQNKLSASTASSLVTKAVSKMGQVHPSTSGMKTSVYDQQSKDTSRYNDKAYKVVKEASLNNDNYVLLQSGNTPLGWFKASDVNTKSLSKEQKISGQYTVHSQNGGLYAVPWGTSKQRIDTLRNLTNNLFTATKKVNVGDMTYLFGNVNKKTGWINEKDVSPKSTASKPSSLRTATTPSNTAAKSNLKEDYFVTNKKGYYYAKPDNKTKLGSLSSYFETLFTIEQRKLAQGITWYYGHFNDGRNAWLKASDLRSILVHYYQSSLTLNEALKKQYALTPKPQTQHTPGTWEDATLDETRQAMDTTKSAKDPTQMYQFLKLDQSQGLSASQLNKLLAGKGILAGQGEAFRQASLKYNINEIYLISHAFLETGNGTSKLANGGYVDKNNNIITNGKVKYYNMFGIGAYDQDALRNGFKAAERYGWNTVSKAIIGGAQFIRERYIDVGQNTLYRMRWNPQNPATHQYATDISWASSNASRIKGFYDLIGEKGKYFDIDNYKK
ncbi:autolysin [Staphylococcus felis]|uniref:GW dipeptide domain-containing protein n=1 Tax=Staphylococcus felis TaxID=46127 RepID=UPI000E22E034|nr:GW dipeptide domain-containing protein [Staphylococcus felis]REI11550.1 autolysin [Staphylococcus felis]REI31674.1 autolysin [Staphylococcus felis]